MKGSIFMSEPLCLWKQRGPWESCMVGRLAQTGTHTAADSLDVTLRVAAIDGH
ncbi:hypothetical protein EYF80_067256 [Liparis tanakae]|uniref:Uncharacterized protein n=1 Tax=Liparis tanakae TaxID=230148 RepID=A0A4Z2E1I9_9TELE|nr:hypothetical protein EYF80_067256 [Liparis tanakae]